VEGGLSSLEQAGERKVQQCFAEFCGFGKVFPVVA